jgi:parallel beta-helix repeat protein
MKALAVFLMLYCSVQVLGQKVIYVATNGNDSNPGTIEQPFATWKKGIDEASAGDQIYIRGGTYYIDSVNGAKTYIGVNITKNGAPGNPIKLYGYPGEKPVLECSGLSHKIRGRGIYISGDYWELKNFEVIHVNQYRNVDLVVGILGDNCNNNVFENLKVHDCGGPGIRIIHDSDNNLVKNCDAWNNYDPLTTSPGPGGNADGFQCGYIPTGRINYFKGCRAWWNSDDGWDLWYNHGIVVIDSCWAFRNGYKHGTFEYAGDGNGIKMGKTSADSTAMNTYQRIVRNCVVFQNKQHGFDYNGGDVQYKLYNNTSYQNRGIAYRIPCDLQHDIKNNISYNDGISWGKIINISELAIQSNNTWNGGFTVTDADFESLDTTGIVGMRNEDGTLSRAGFLRLVSNSDLRDGGIDVGLPYADGNPDLGCFEFYENADSLPNVGSHSFTIQDTVSRNIGIYKYNIGNGYVIKLGEQ